MFTVQTSLSTQSDITKPRLKRNYNEFIQTKNNPTLYKNLFIQTSSDSKPASKPILSSVSTLTAKQQQPKKKESISSEKECQAAKPECSRCIQEKVCEIMNDDIHESIHEKGRKNYCSRYLQRQDCDNIWVSEPSQIPNQVKRQYQQCSSSPANQEKVNFIQGFLSQIGFIYYGVQRKVFFYDIEQMNADSECLFIIETEEKVRNVLYGIQILELKQPYFVTTKHVLALLHYYEVELYGYTVFKDDHSNSRALKIKSLNISYKLEVPQPKKLVIDNQGLLYYTDHKGSLKWINQNLSTPTQIALNVALTTKQLSKSVVSFWNKTKKNISLSISSFNRVVGNIKKSVFPSQALRSSIVSDLSRNIIVTYFSQRLSNGEHCHQIKVYSPKNKTLLYSLSEYDFLDRHSLNDLIVDISVIDFKLHQGYNLVVLLSSGKRVFLDLTENSFNKSIIYQTNPTNKIKYLAEQSQRQYKVESYLLEDTFFATLLLSNTDFCFSFIRNELTNCDEVLYKVNVKKVIEQTQYQMFSRDLQALGPQKQSLLQEQPKQQSIQRMCSKIQGVFFRPKELVHASDMLVRRIIILREVDIIFTLVHTLDNIPHILKGLQFVLKGVKTQDLISYLCQILFDSEGVYWVSNSLATKVKKKLDIRVFGFQNQYGLDEVEFKTVTSEKKNQTVEFLETILVDLSLENGINKESGFINGFLGYFCRLLKPLWNADINKVTHNTCKTVITLLKTCSQFLLKFKKKFRIHSNDSLVSATLNWLQLIKQLFFVISAIPTLPSKPLHAALEANPSQFHQYLFKGLKIYDFPAIDKFSKLASFYFTSELMQSFKFWLTFEQQKTIQTKLSVCLKKQSIPEYLLKEISKVRGMEEVRLRFQAQQISPQEIKQFHESLTFQEMLERVKEGTTTLVDKELLLEQAKLKLEAEMKNDQDKLNQGKTQIQVTAAQIHLQRLLKQFYVQKKRENFTLKDKLQAIIEKSPQISNYQQIVNILESHLFDTTTLAELIAITKDPLLEAAFANYFDPRQTIQIIKQLITDTIAATPNLKELATVFKEQIVYLIAKAKINTLEKEVIIKLYIEDLSKIPAIITILKDEKGILESQLFFPLLCLTELCGEPQQIYKWGFKKLNTLEKSSDFFLYLSACMTYFLRKYATDKKEQFCFLLSEVSDKNRVFEKMKALLV